MSSNPLTLLPGALLNIGETLTVTADRPGEISLERRIVKEKKLIKSITLSPDALSFSLTLPETGSYVLTYKTQDETLTRYVGVIDKGWAVCQMTVGAFTSEDFDEVVHDEPVPVDYYITTKQFSEIRWRNYERLFGDAIHPHVHADSMGGIDKAFSHNDPNWDSLETEQIIAQLEALKEHWLGLGYRRLDRIATYTHCNKLVEACRKTGIKILHSVIPEQNWSDGEWIINHWGMPTCPFWVSRDNFRKPGTRTDDGVLAMTMNQYQVLLAHLTHWCDFALSPSFFARWHRTNESGPHPVRFEQLARDTAAHAESKKDWPLFFVAGFEFGRTLGTGIMTDYNIAGIKTLIKMSGELPLVFACSGDVLAYYQRHIPNIAERVLHQRDYWAGAKTMGKPAIADDSVVVERSDYKALIRENQIFAWFHYDYLPKWDYPVAATDVPENFSDDDRLQLSVEMSGDKVSIKAEKPLTRTIPIMLWDAKVVRSEWPVTPITILDNGRNHALIEVGKGWHGECELLIEKQERIIEPKPSWWQCKTFGGAENVHTYLHFDLPLVCDVEIPVELLGAASVDSSRGQIGSVGKGELILTVGPQRTWHRFWGVGKEQIRPTDETIKIVSEVQASESVLSENWKDESLEHRDKLQKMLLSKFDLCEGDAALSVFCGAALALGGRSRAAEFDIAVSKYPGLSAYEYGDGVFSYGPGKNFWEHPRELRVKVHGLGKYIDNGKVTIILNSFEPFVAGAKLKVSSGDKDLPGWQLPDSPFADSAWYRFEVDSEWFDHNGDLPILLTADQKAILYDWWQEKGFIAGLHGLWVIIKK